MTSVRRRKVKLGTESIAGIVEAATHRAGGDLHHGGDLGRGEFLPRGQPQKLAVVVGEPLERGANSEHVGRCWRGLGGEHAELAAQP